MQEEIVSPRQDVDFERLCLLEEGSLPEVIETEDQFMGWSERLALFPSYGGESIPEYERRECRGYRLLAKTQGGICKIIVAVDERTGKIVVLRKLRRDSGTLETDEGFKRELEILRYLRGHKRWGRLIDILSEECCVMEFIPGISLRHLINKWRMRKVQEQPEINQRIEIAARIGQGVAQGLQAVHDLGIANIDMSTPNIILTRHGVKLIDLNVLNRIPILSMPMIGRIEYMAPEVDLAQPFDGRADLFSVGCVLFEIVCCGGKAFTACEMRELRLAKQQGRYSSRSLPDHPIKDVIKALLEPKPENRPRDAQELLRILEPFADPVEEIIWTPDASSLPSERERAQEVEDVRRDVHQFIEQLFK